jgi:dolichol-phosphate mannosyltransferase
MIDVSIIIPVYFNEGSLNQTINNIYKSVVKVKNDKVFEIIFIDDGSADNSLQEILNIKTEYKALIKVIKFTSNFGQVNAIMAGYRLAKGRCVINISADMQDPPELMVEMIDVFFNEKIPIVICVREARDENLFRKKTSNFFYYLMQKMNFSNMPIGGFDYALLSKEVVDIICDSNESNPFWQGQILNTGYPIKFIPYVRRKREIGTSKWTFSKKIKYLIDGVLGYSYLPLRLMTIMGIFIFIAGLLYASFIFISYFFGNSPFTGWTPIMILLLLFSGLQMLFLGIIGEYLWRILDQVRNRKPYIIEKTYE